MSTTLEIITPRLTLVVPRIEFAHEVNHAINQNWHELQKWMSWSHDSQNSLEATEHYIKNIVPQNITDGGLPLQGFCRKTGRFVIATGIHIEDGNYAAGYWVALPFQGRGLASEACNAVVRYAFNKHGVKDMHICHYEGNAPSERVIRKLGFEENGIRPKAHARCLDGVFLDVHDYIMADYSVLPDLQVTWGERCP